MPRKKYKYHYIYKTTNIINGDFYVGMHSTHNLNDGYLGSGTRLRRFIKKYGKENFIIEILEFLPNRDELKQREKEIINENLLKIKNCINIQYGGGGGFINKKHQKKCSEAGNKAFKLKLETDVEFRNQFQEKCRNSLRIRVENGDSRMIRKGNKNWLGKKHKPHSIEKMKKSAIGKHDGEKNSQFGTCWITNGSESKKMKKTEMIPIGWWIGRTQKVNK